MKPAVSAVSNAARVLFRVLGDTRAATAVEYGIIIGLVVISMIVGLSELAKSTTGMWNNVNTKVEAAH